MRLYVEPMDSVVVEVNAEGQVRYEGADTAWATPSLQERRAIIYAAREEAAALAELLEIFERADPSPR